MKAGQFLQTYLNGWQAGDGEMSLSATVPGFYYDDPNTGRITRDNFLAFVEEFKAGVADMRGGQIGTPFLEYTDTLISPEASIAWCWWRATGTDFQGAAIIKFGDEGVICERIAYFTELNSG